MPYGSVVLDRFFNPRNAGSLASPDGLGIIGTPGRGDFVEMFIKVAAGRIVAAKFLSFTCPVAVAACDMAAQLVHSLSIAEARCLSPEDVALALRSVPEEKMSRCQLAIAAVRAALDDYESSTRTKIKGGEQ